MATNKVQQLLTDNINLWTGAIEQKSSAGRGNNGKKHLYGIKKLRELILELAVRGKLVSQDANEEPASELLTRIAAERDRLVKEKKIKKPKKLPKVGAGNHPFELPEGWEQVSLSHLGIFTGGKTPSKSNNQFWDGNIPWVTPKDMKKNIITDSQDHVTPEALEAGLSEVAPDSLLFVVRSGILRRKFPTAIVKSSCTVNQDLKVLTPFDTSISEYVLLMMQGFERYILENLTKVGTTVESIQFDRFATHYFIIPPEREQHRIVAKVDELMALCDRLEQQTEQQLDAHQQLVDSLLGTLTQSQNAEELADNWARLSQHFDTLFTTAASIDQLKQTVLQLAVMGKLVPQNPNDESASALLERIATEKAQLVKEKKIKKQKPLPPISDEEKPFELPQGWEWIKFGEVALFINGDRSKSYPNKSEYVDHGIPWINTGHIEPNGTLSTSTMNFITMEKFEALKSGKIEPNDLVYCLRGATFGKTSFVSPYTEGAIASSLMIIRPYFAELNQYVFRYLTSPFGRSQIFRFDNGSAQPNLSANSVMMYAFPCPPRSEQHRIVTKVNELFTLCDQLTERLQQNQHTQLLLTDTLVQESLR